MNNEILSGKWNELKGKVKETFGKLTDDDLMQVQGSSDRIVGALQQRYGYSKERAQQEWDTFANKHTMPVKDATTHVLDAAKATVKDAKEGVAKMAKTVADKVEGVTNRP